MSERTVPGGTEAPEPAPEAPKTPTAAPDAAGSTASPAPTPSAAAPASGSGDGNGAGTAGDSPTAAARKRRRRGSRGGRKRSKPRTDGRDAAESAAADGAPAARSAAGPSERGAPGRSAETAAPAAGGDGHDDRAPELPDLHREGRPASVEAAAKALVRKAAPAGAPSKPKIGDTIPADALRSAEPAKPSDAGADGGKRRRRRRGGRGRSSGSGATQAGRPVEAVIAHEPVDLDEETLERRRGRERKGRPVGRYMMTVHVTAKATQIAVLEGRSLIEHYVSHPSDDVSQIHGNIYLGRVQNVLPGMEAAFVDIGTPKNAVLYRGDVHYDPEDIESGATAGRPRIEDVLKAGQTILCQVTKNPIGAKGARLTQEVSLPGRFVVLIPNSSTYGISKRLPDEERKRLRSILDRVKPAQHGVIVRTAAESVTTEEIEDDVRRLLSQWEQIERLAKRSKAPALLYREPDMAVRVIREEFSQEYRSVLIDDRDLYAAVRDYVASISPELADRVEYYDPETESLPMFERHHVHEQLHRALDRKVWLPSGGSLIIERTEALTVIDVNTGKNVGRSSLEETVFKNNLEAAVEVARQLRLRDIGGIIVVDFIDMERRDNREEVVRVFRDALSRDKTRTQVFEISELGICEMTRKRIGEGLLESFAERCPECEGRGVLIDKELLPD
ncbi:MAG TPA: Rne/Rng family ribonuclease [Acidimicrobiales bacterium]|nr:Rne/Rng family ribonuclease [Acidimicrobiales bacterium]